MYKKYIELYDEYKSDCIVDDLKKINEFNKERIDYFYLKNELYDAKKRIYKYVTNNITDEKTQNECYTFINSIIEKKTTEETFKRTFIQRYEIFIIENKNKTSTIQFEKYSHTDGHWDTNLYINNTPVEKYCNIDDKDKINIIPLMELYDEFCFKYLTSVRFLFLILNLSDPDVTDYIDTFNCTNLVNCICKKVVDKHIKNMLLLNNFEEYEIKSIVQFNTIENENDTNIDELNIYFKKIKYIYFVAYFSMDDDKLVYTYEFLENNKIVKHENFLKIENGKCIFEQKPSEIFNKIIEKSKLKSLDKLHKIIDIITSILINK